MALTKINNNTLSAITGLPAGVGGKVLQVVSTLSSVDTSTTGTTMGDTGLEASITPSSTSNKILFKFHLLQYLLNALGTRCFMIFNF